MSSYSKAISSSLILRAAAVSRGSRRNWSRPVSIVGQGALLRRLLGIASRSLPFFLVRSCSILLCDKDLGKIAEYDGKRKMGKKGNARGGG